MQPVRDLWKKCIILGLLGLWLAAAVLFGRACPFHSVTGLPCPGCGMTRAWLSLLRGDLTSAFRYHGMFWSLPVLLLLFFCDGRLFSRRWANLLLWSLLLLGFLANWAFQLSKVL